MIFFFVTGKGIQVDDGVVKLATCQTFWAMSYYVGNTLVTLA